ncbi:alpha-hydroxy acid oxidase [Deinococcus hopiensis]|uniref:FMN-dependent dehydrogenase, includes L-lactate dehydrogenase and type II isopentenyl diphosphate isomerase n=1 Tax=Deinococcus hopiensis KR-140 TaxID=695939 RepID=A0A1W1VRB7_9DEIO|nr:alpha-hydroxy acid oxidase [Deinococcus hopiensis]SMB95770.1 FMN-dependent dehydrogenase, includes L-lactate dehydrogenase and type II isopentenyl diphosphate isomerase [Deinococcus hopiensis KR-140]
MTTINLPEAGEPGLEGTVNLADIETLGRLRLDRNALEYYASGANDEVTLRENREGFRRLRLRPRMLVDVSHVNTHTEVLGLPLGFPVGIAPSAFHGLADPEAELATARAAAAAGSVMTLSTFSNTPIEDVAVAAAGRFWFQLYLYTDREVSADVVRRAEAAGARALVLTVDAPFLGRREPNERHRFTLPPHLSVPNAGTREQLAQLESERGSQLVNYFQTLVDKTLSWSDLAWLRSVTTLPIVLKGILTAEDALLAAQHGCHVWVSNHGGRQLDTAVSSVEALSEVVDAVAGRTEVYLDGGVTRGTDVVKAVALGARCVFLGRAALWGLAAGGEAGVRRTLDLLHGEVRLAMALCGKQNVGQLGRDLLRS